MSDVAAVSFDEQTKSSVHVWTARGVKSLNRKNKLSSRVFAAPEVPAAFGQYHFRLILLRGVVKAMDAANDPVSLFIELQGEPFPARMRIEAVATDVEGKELKRDETHIAFDETTRAADFKTFIGAELFNALSDDAVAIQVTLQFEQSLASGLWASAAGVSKSFWGGATRALSTVAESGASLFSHRAAMEGRTEEADPAPKAGHLCPWDEVPSKWQDREERWGFLLQQYLPQNEATFIRGPREFTSNEELLLTQAGLSVKACLRAAQVFDADRDIHEGLITTGSHTLRGMRFEVVPAKVSEETFWHNYFWRVECLKLCSTDEQSKVVLSILDAPVAGTSSGGNSEDGAAGAQEGVGVSPSGRGRAEEDAADAEAAHDAEVAALINACREARSTCEELLGDELSDVDIVQAAGHSLRQALAALGDLSPEDTAAAQATLEKLDAAVQQAEAAPSTPADAIGGSGSAAVTPEKAPTPEPEAPAAAEASPAAPEEPASSSPQTEQAAEADAAADEPDASPEATSKRETLEATPAARSSAGSAVLMPWEEEDD
eukprot:CAMPEP_0174852772 /NCGR_PEP_ID=MMETSP1114-20130205/26712_1 /TAXON_ID=312471 /ORGANISM="Neobodo designis, Strain CCAP 1951/1" /LENGTH=547 /DNA_ID=CAMNT_0016087387 /DNA_START=96 /DNA_END=1739 /DNA_ORIENTATION=+